MYLRDGGTFLRNHGGTASSNKMMDLLLLFSYNCSCRRLFCTKIIINSQSYHVQTWKIWLCDGGTFMLAPRYFYPRSFHCETDFFFNFYLVPKPINSLNSCFMMKKSVLKTFEPSLNFSKCVPQSHLYDFGNGTRYFTTLANLNIYV